MTCDKVKIYGVSSCVLGEEWPLGQGRTWGRKTAEQVKNAVGVRDSRWVKKSPVGLSVAYEVRSCLACVQPLRGWAV